MNKLSFQEYHLLTRRTLPDLDYRYRINSSTYRESPVMFPEGTFILPLNMLETTHMIMGMFSEIKELAEAIEKGDIINIQEELCDILWYASNYAYLKQIDISGYQFPRTGIAGVEDVAIAISGLSDFPKKHLAYRREPNRDNEVRDFFTVLNTVGEAANVYKIDLGIGIKNNIDKLIKRFPEKFDYVKAQQENRDLDAERKELEK